MSEIGNEIELWVLVYRRYSKPGSCLGSSIPPGGRKLPPGGDVCRGQFGAEFWLDVREGDESEIDWVPVFNS